MVIGPEKTRIAVTVKVSTKEKLEALTGRTELSLSEYVNGLLEEVIPGKIKEEQDKLMIVLAESFLTDRLYYESAKKLALSPDENPNYLPKFKDFEGEELHSVIVEFLKWDLWQRKGQLTELHPILNF